MKTLLLNFVAVICLSFIFTSCTTNTEKISGNEVPTEILDALTAKGFSLDGVVYTAATDDAPEGYLVEGDILMTRDEVLGQADEMTIPEIGLEEEQYRTRNLVRVNAGTRRVIRVKPASNLNTKTKQALNRAITRFNSLGLTIRFIRVVNNPHITLRYNSSLSNYGGRAGFPRNGNPYPRVDIHPTTTNLNSHTLSRLIMHELGHCIGMRHTDFYDRRSCNQNINEGGAGVGAIHIPGTTKGRDNASVFKACYSFGDNSIFSNNDKRALRYIY